MHRDISFAPYQHAAVREWSPMQNQIGRHWRHRPCVCLCIQATWAHAASLSITLKLKSLLTLTWAWDGWAANLTQFLTHSLERAHHDLAPAPLARVSQRNSCGFKKHSTGWYTLATLHLTSLLCPPWRFLGNTVTWSCRQSSCDISSDHDLFVPM